MSDRVDIAHLNGLSHSDAVAFFEQACGARDWAEKMAHSRPFRSLDEILGHAHAVWSEAQRETILEAFAHHPRIGADMDKLRQKFATADMSCAEQSGVNSASESTLSALCDGNVRYEERFGHIFIVCASGKSADEMLQLLGERIDNEPTQELAFAAAEQGKITELRLRSMIEESP